MKETCIKLLKTITGKEYIIFTKRGNKAIELTLKYLKSSGKEEISIQNQGGWITYKQYIDKFKFRKKIIKTDYGIIDPETLDKTEILLINSMPGYQRLQNMKDLLGKAEIIINDISGSIFTSEAVYGDIIFGSFGKWKPVNVEHGGFIAADSKEFAEFLEENNNFEETEGFFEKLYERLSTLDQRTREILKIKKNAEEKFSRYDIISDKKGLNLIVKYNNENEKKNIIRICNDEKLEFTECPRYIRVYENAISIEIKRKL